VGSTACTIAIASTGAGASTAGLSLLAFLFGVVGIGWNGVQHTWMAELAGPRAAGTAVGLGLAVSSAGVTLGPLIFGAFVQRAGGFHTPWLALALSMAAALGLLFLVPERRPR
jgi:predicted MFS family arabinose efflux permease